MGPTKRPRRLAAAALSAVAIASLGIGPPATAAPPNDDPANQDWIAAKVRDMSLKEKVGQLFVTYAYGRTADTVHPDNKKEFGVDTPAQVVQKYHLGGLIHFNWTDSLHNPKQIAKHSNGVQKAAMNSGAEIPMLISTDQEQGAITRIREPATQLPGNMALGAGRSAEDAALSAEITGKELRAMGLQQNFAPSGDVNVNPANPVIGVRSFSSDPRLAAEFTAAQVRGYQEGSNTSGAVKHFPGHGDTNQDSHEALPVIEHTREQWEKLDAPPFYEAIEAGTDSVMTAHIVVPKLDDSGEPSTLSRNVLTGMLRKEMNYDGVIVTDSLQMEGVRQKHPDGEIPVKAIEAGADQMLMPQDLPLAIDSVMKAVKNGRLTEERIDQSVTRILEMKAKRGALKDPLVDVDKVDDIVGSPEHMKAAQKITDRTTNVLRNDADVLPLREKPKKMLVTGTGGEDYDPTTSLAKEIENRGTKATSLNTGAEPTPEKIQEAVKASKNNDMTVVLTHAAWDDKKQQELVRALEKTGKPVVAVAVRDPYDAAYVEKVQTWAATYSDKPVAMKSLAKVMFGEVKPQGKLPVPVPAPDNPEKERFPFGHGVSW